MIYTFSTEAGSPWLVVAIWVLRTSEGHLSGSGGKKWLPKRKAVQNSPEASAQGHTAAVGHPSPAYPERSGLSGLHQHWLCCVPWYDYPFSSGKIHFERENAAGVCLFPL